MAVMIKQGRNGEPAGAFGWNGGLGTSWMADPASGITAILLTQTLFESADPPVWHKAFWRRAFALA
jgi:CubicO group peptidase (beta-lactamase class C family)